MNRRQLLTMIAAMTGTAMIGANRAFAYLPTETGPNIFSDDDAAFLDEVAEVIIPATDTPGAKDAGVGAFMTVFVSDCYTKEEQDDFRAGMEQLKSEAESTGTPFLDMTPEERLAFLQGVVPDARAQAKLVEEAKERAKQSQDQQSNADQAGEAATAEMAEALPKLHWYTPIEQLTLMGFFTSEVGATQVLRYEAVPGEYIGDLDYDGEPAWAT
ncbi:gluconate 2-dehydrogenase subunit 3 family protein [Paracoccus indicus]|uniref:gluconate 2-dehydrogenase subunit 3 family protein n=1 Tax=Paracoccus indicus TaxID=2079229 RepID=UPI000D3B40DC|nr:gluconate 2-dehydrogenase subunit 3 family protein [Paracoccus indicus]